MDTLVGYGSICLSNILVVMIGSIKVGIVDVLFGMGTEGFQKIRPPDFGTVIISTYPNEIVTLTAPQTFKQ